MAKDPSTVASRWAQNLGAAGQKVTDGVMAVTTAPGAAAAAQVGVWAANTQAAQAKFARNVAAIPLSSWQQSVVNKGIPRLASGAQAAEPKFQQFMTKLLPYVASGRTSLPKRGSYQQNVARLTAWVDYMHKFQK
jgi:hypothetical protein